MTQLAELWKKEFQQKGIPSSFKSEPSHSVLGFEQHLRQNGCRKGTLLDLGAGKGRNSIYMRQNGFRVSCVDLLSENIEAIRKADSEIDACCCDLTRGFPFANASFDYAMDVFCFKHLVDEAARATYVSELERVLKKKGLYLLSLASVDDGFYGPLLASSPQPERRMIVDPHTHIPSILYRKSDIEKLFSRFSLLEFSEKRSMGEMHGKLYSRCVLSFIFELPHRG